MNKNPDSKRKGFHYESKSNFCCATKYWKNIFYNFMTTVTCEQ